MSSWTPDQLAFIRAPGHCVAVAGPGSGKTSSLIEKMVQLARQPANRIIACTFTSDGAKEMEHRLVKKLGDMPHNVVIGTWHKIALDHRRTHGREAATLNAAHQFALLKRMISARVSADELRMALVEFERIKCSMDSIYEQVPHEWFHAYQAELKTLGVIDLYDAMRETAVLIREGQLPLFPATHLLVDESQDNDEVQFALSSLHASAGIVTTLVGDDDQAIYEWRHARGFSGMEDFIKKQGATVITMGDNFRSRGNIVACADELIRNNNGFRLPKTFIARRGEGGSVAVLGTSSWISAAESMIQSMAPLLTEKVDAEGKSSFEVPTGAVTVLARNNYMLDSIEAALELADIKTVRNGGSMWKTPPANMLSTVLAWLSNCSDARGLDAALHIGGLSESVITKLNRHFRGHAGGFLAPGESFGFLQDGAAGQAGAIATRLSAISRQIEQKEYRAAIGASAAFVGQLYQDKTLENYRYQFTLRAVAKKLYKLRGPIPARLKAARDALKEKDSTHAVVLQTFHGSKGQEFSNVFLLGVDQDIIPGRSERRAERRLLYVACTRAKDALVITHTAGKASEFLREFTPRAAA